MVKTIWTDEMIAIAAGMRRAGFHAKKIGERLGLSGSVVQVKTHKIGVLPKLNYRRRHHHCFRSRNKLDD